MTNVQIDQNADQELKGRHRAMWALGDYPSVASEVIAALGPRLADACAISPGERVLDVAAGAGNVAVAAAQLGATVVASDLTPELLEVGRRRNPELAERVSWEVGDAEKLPYPDESFDAALSCVGVMFAPHHQQAANELVRVLRPGGRLGLINWTPAGFIGQMFATMKPYAPPPPPGASPPPLWGSPDHVAELFGDSVTDLVCQTQRLPVTRFADGAEFRDFFKKCYGPTIAVYRGLAERPTDAADLDAALAALGDDAIAAASRGDDSSELARPSMTWEYLLVTARRR